MGLIFGHVECQRVSNDKLKILFDEIKSIGVICSPNRLLSHFENTHRFIYYLSIAKNILVFGIVEVLELIEYFQLLNDPLNDFPPVFETTIRTSILGFV